MTEYSIY